MLELSASLYYVTFSLYLAAAVLFLAGLFSSRIPRLGGGVGVAAPGIAIPGPSEGAALGVPSLPRWGERLAETGIVAHLVALTARWLGGGQAPWSTMHEVLSLLAFTSMAFLWYVNRGHRLPALGAFVAPVGALLIAWASLFPRDVRPLIPALQSHWLVFHVGFVILGVGAFTVAFGASLLYLLRTYGEAGRAGRAATELIFYLFSAVGGFVLLSLAMRATGLAVAVADPGGPPVLYRIPPVVAATSVPVGSLGRWLGLPLPLVHPFWNAGAQAAAHVNTLLFSLLAGLGVYGLLRLWAGQPLSRLAARAVRGADPETLDHLGYRSIALGYPLFTLGGMLFAMIWAQIAWGAYWQWDPKETWTAIAWLVYSGYLHLRISRGWTGRPAAWIAVLGFAAVVFNLVGVNLVIAGLHSYAA